MLQIGGAHILSTIKYLSSESSKKATPVEIFDSLSSIYAFASSAQNVVLTDSNTFSKTITGELSTDSPVTLSDTFFTTLARNDLSTGSIIVLKELAKCFKVEDKNMSHVVSLIDSLGMLLKKDPPSLLMTCMELISVFLGNRTVLMKTNFVKSKYLGYITRNTRHNNANVRRISWNTLNAFINGSLGGFNNQGFHETFIKTLKSSLSSSEKSMPVRASILQCTTSYISYTYDNAAISSQIQAILLKELSLSAAVGHTYGIFLSTSHINYIHGLKSKEEKSVVKESKSLASIIEHLCSIYSKNNRKEVRESLNECFKTIIGQLSISYIEQNLATILTYLDFILAQSNSKSKDTSIEESKSMCTAIFKLSVYNRFPETKLKTLLTYLFDYIQKKYENSSDKGIIENVSFYLNEALYLVGILNEGVLELSNIVEEFIQFMIPQVMPKTFKTVASCKLKSLWMPLGLLIRKYSSINEQYYVLLSNYEKYLPAPFGSSKDESSIVPACWLASCTKKQLTESEFRRLLDDCKSVLSDKSTSDIKMLATWILFSGLFADGKFPKDGIFGVVQDMWTSYTSTDKLDSEEVFLVRSFIASSMLNYLQACPKKERMSLLDLIAQNLETTLKGLTHIDLNSDYVSIFIITALSLFSRIVEKIDLQNEDQTQEKSLSPLTVNILQLIVNLLTTVNTPLESSFLRHFVSSHDDLLFTPPTEMQGYSIQSFSGYAPFHTSLSKFAMIINNVNAIKSSSTASYIPIQLSAIQSLCNTFSLILSKENDSRRAQCFGFLGEFLSGNLNNKKSETAVICTLTALCKLFSDNCALKAGHQNQLNQCSNIQPFKKSLLVRILRSVEPYLTVSNPEIKILASYIISYICDLDEAVHASVAKNMINSLPSIKDDTSLTGHLFCLGLIHKIVGGIRTGKYSKDLLLFMCTSLKNAYTQKNHESSRWILHSLWYTLEVSSLSFHLTSSVVVDLVRNLFIDDFTMTSRLTNQLGRILSSITQAYGPEIQMDQRIMDQLKNMLLILHLSGCHEAKHEFKYLFNPASNEKGIKMLDFGSFISCHESASAVVERIVLFGLQSINFVAKVKQLLLYLSEKETYFDTEGSFGISTNRSMRLNAAQTLKLFAQFNPQLFSSEQVLNLIINMFDTETCIGLRNELYSALISIEEVLIKDNYVGWINLCCSYVLGEKRTQNEPVVTPIESEKGDEDNPEESGMINISPTTQQTIDNSNDMTHWTHSTHLIAFSTRGIIKTIKNSNKSDLEELEKLLPKIVPVAFKCVNYPNSEVKSYGLGLVHTILDTFSDTPDKEFEGHYVLELYVAQLGASLRQALLITNPLSSKFVHMSFTAQSKLVIWVLQHIQDTSSLGKLIRPFQEELSNMNAINQVSDLDLKSRLGAFLIASALLFEHLDDNTVQAYFANGEELSKLRDGWYFLTLFWFANENKRDHIISNELLGCNFDWISVLTALSKHFKLDNVTLIKRLIALSLSSIESSHSIRLLKILNNLLKNSEVPIFDSIVEIEVLVKLLSKLLNTQSELVVDILDSIESIITQLLPKSGFGFEETSSIRHCLSEMLQQSLKLSLRYPKITFMAVVNSICRSWPQLLASESKSAYLMSVFYDLPHLVTQWDSALEQDIIASIKQLQINDSDSFLLSQVATLVNKLKLKSSSDELGTYWVSCIFSTLSNLAHYTESSSLHSDIVSTIMSECLFGNLKSLRLFIQQCITSSNEYLRSLGRSYLALALPEVVKILSQPDSMVSTTEAYIELINMLILMRSAEKNNYSVEKTVITVLITSLNDVESSHPYALIHNTSLQLLLKLAQTTSTFKEHLELLTPSLKEKFASAIQANMQKQTQLAQQNQSSSVNLDFSKYS